MSQFLATISVFAPYFILIVLILLFYCDKKLSNPNSDHSGRRRGPPPPPAPSSTDRIPAAPVPPAVKTVSLFQFRQRGFRGTNADCSICLDEFVEGEVCRILPTCRHVFHRHCVDLWLIKERHCPLCRSVIRVRVASTQRP